MMAADSTVPAEFRHRGGHKKVTQRAINYIEIHYHERVYLATVARICGISGSRFSRPFKLEQGVTFSQYLSRYRTTRAMEQLQRPGASVTEVAFAVGFSSPSHFSHCFRRYGQISPSEYRRHMGLAPGDAVGGVALTRQQMTSDRA